MGLLKSLESENPIIDSHFQNFCISHGIHTVEDFLLHDIDKLVTLTESQPNPERLKQGITRIISIIDGMHQPLLNGMELLRDALENKHFLSTGLNGMDSILRGGLQKGQLTELVGPSSSGKTQVCLRVASYVAQCAGFVVYIDTGNSFSAQRIASFVEQSSECISNQARQEILEKVMSSIFCHSVFDIFAMVDVLHQLEFNICRGDNQVQLLIVDCISSLITPVLGGSSSNGHALMVSAGVMLKKLAHEHNVAVLVTNHTVGGDAGLVKPALGESWKSIPHVRLLLSSDHERSIYTVSVLKHPSVASGKTSRIAIEE